MPNNKPFVRAGVDIGGTFTDIAIDVDGRIHSAKVLTDQAEPDRAIVEGLRSSAETAGISLGDIRMLIHGTTLATNALIEKRGARTVFVTTEGFRDVLEMRTESRFEQYDLNIKLPPALIERADRLTLRERIAADGSVLIEPDGDEIDRLAELIAEREYDSVAIGFLHSYVNAAHERLMGKAITERLPNVAISLSSEVSPQMREYERFNTVCANAYVKPLMKSYLDRLEGSLMDIGVDCPLFMMHSGGGIIPLESASEFPVRLVESGPAGGAIFAADLARRYALPSVLSYDMGGTTAKICMIEEQVPKTTRSFEVARTHRFKKGSGMPISIPVVEMVEIGAGGGSIASVDILRQIRVGPQSAGSEPGPACYQRGGEDGTVTDADLLLGRIDPDDFAGGSIVLSADSAATAIDGTIGSALGLETFDAAYGICEVVDENMANAGRVHAVENGKDLSTFLMITFGGAGPLHAVRLCEKMGIDRFLVPAGAGVGSAIGFLRAPVGFEAVRSAPVNLDTFDGEAIHSVVSEMAEEALDVVRQGSDGSADPLVERTAYMRYVGQGWEIPVEISEHVLADDTGARFRETFEQAYTRFFGRPVEGLTVEIVSWSVKATLPLPPVEPIDWLTDGDAAPVAGRRRVFDASAENFVDAAVYARDDLSVGMSLKGPAVVVERETSTMIPRTFTATVQPDGCLLAVRNDL